MTYSCMFIGFVGDKVYEAHVYHYGTQVASVFYSEHRPWGDIRYTENRWRERENEIRNAAIYHLKEKQPDFARKIGAY